MFRVDPRGLGRICYHLVVEDWVLEETVEPFVVLIAARSLGMKNVHNENIYYCTYLLYWGFMALQQISGRWKYRRVTYNYLKIYVKGIIKRCCLYISHGLGDTKQNH